jgi:hypothetical protein
VIAPFVTAPGNHNESPLLREALPEVTSIARQVGIYLQGCIVSLDGVYDCRANRKMIFNRGMVPNINPNPRGRKQPKRGRKPIFDGTGSRLGVKRRAPAEMDRWQAGTFVRGRK